MRTRLLTLPLVSAFLALALMSCTSTRVYVETHDLLYEDDILIQEESRLTRDGVRKSGSVTTYHDLSSAGYIVTDSSRTTTTAHSFTAKKTSGSSSGYDDVEYSLVETVVDTSANKYSTEVIGTKTARLSADGTFATFAGTDGSPAQQFKGDTFSEQDEAFFKEVALLTAPGLIAGFGDISEETGKSYRTEESIEEVTVNSVPNGQYIAYQFLGKPFVILGTATWNVIKCLGYSLYNFVGGYNLTQGDNRQDMPIWMMPSMSTARTKFEEGKEANAIVYYPQYHIPFTDNTITVVKTEQMSNEAFIDDDNKVNVSSFTFDYTNEVSVSRSAKADAAYTAGVAGLIGTAVTIPVAGLSWVAGVAGGIAMQVAGK